MKTFQTAVTVVALCLGLSATHAAFADANSNAVKMANGLNAPKVYTGIHPPQGKPTKSSGLAPRGGMPRERVSMSCRADNSAMWRQQRHRSDSDHCPPKSPSLRTFSSGITITLGCTAGVALVQPAQTPCQYWMTRCAAILWAAVLQGIELS